MTRRHRIALALTALALSVPTAAAQDLGKRRATHVREAAELLLGFARTAESAKSGNEARKAYELILLRYDPDQQAARKALGFRRDKTGWQPPAEGAGPKFVDASDLAAQKKVAEAWSKVTRKLAEQHRELGLAERAAGDEAHAKENLELATHYDPTDKVAHAALGHAEYQGFFGSATDVAFVQRMAEILARAQEIATTEIEVEPLEASALPEELKRTQLEFAGAKSAGVAVWIRGSQAEAAEIARWSERAELLLDFLLMGDRELRAECTANLRHRKWIAVMRIRDERDKFLQLNPNVLQKRTLAEVKLFDRWYLDVDGVGAELALHAAAEDRDYAVARVAMHGFASRGNEGLGQGLVHAMTVLLLDSMQSFYGELPGSVSKEEADALLSPTPAKWRTLMGEQAQAAKDWPLCEVPREHLARFRPQVRIKSWSFVTWLLARYPDQWARLFRAFPTDPWPAREEVAKIIEKQLGAPADGIEAEWRIWARGDTAIARASARAAK